MRLVGCRRNVWKIGRLREYTGLEKSVSTEYTGLEKSVCRSGSKS